MRWAMVSAGIGATLVAGGLVAATPAAADHAHRAGERHCTSGAHTLSRRGDHVYPDLGNGGYRSVHTDVHTVYDATANRFRSGNHVSMLERATQCLSDFSLDFERSSVLGADGPDLAISSITVNGRSARYRFARPTYPGDPKGQNDPDPRAHQMGQNATVGGAAHNPLPPACSPQLTGDTPDAQDGTLCPANKLVITPRRAIRAGARFVVTVHYTGRPGVHLDGDGSTEGWFRSPDGGFVTTEPVGTEDWLPLNNHPSAKPSYDFYDTVAKGKTAIANGVLLTKRPHRPSPTFPSGSSTFHWRSYAPVANYLVENSVGNFDLTTRRAGGGRVYYTAQPSSLSAAQKAKNAAIMAQQEAIVRFQSRFNGPFPFRSDGVLIGLPSASFEEEMQTMITFAGGEIDLDTFNHENMHQWWGDNVSEANFDMTFYKEGMATLGEYLFAAQTAQTAAGGNTAAGRAAFEQSLADRFTKNYARESLFTGIPSDPTSYSLFSGSSTYTRPGTAYLALRQILGATAFDRTLQAIQRRYGGATIDERQLEAAFARGLPDSGRACRARMADFFTQWFDTRYPTADGTTRPSITGGSFAGGGCR